MGPLNGIRVLEAASVLNGPVTGYMLGDLGAEVIKIEPPGTGDPSRGYQTLFDVVMSLPDGGSLLFESANRNKKSIVLDLKNEAGKDIFRKLIEKSDVFITNFSKKSIRELDIGYATLSQYNTRLVYAATTTFGSKGRLSERRGYDMVAQAVSGAMWLFGDRDSPEPSIAVGSIFDQISASMLAYGILAALVARERIGIGQEVESSLLAGAIHLQAQNINAFLWRGRAMARFSRRRCRNPLTNYYKCADDKWILLSEPQSARYWHDFCTSLGMPELENDPLYNTAEARRENYADFIALLDRVFATKPRDEWLRIFDKYDFVYSPVYDYADMANEPQVMENQYLVEMEHPTMGKVKTIGFPVQFSKTPASIQCSAPQFGAHTEQVLQELLGCSWEEIAKLREQGAFG
ncbi:MAG: CoA transferase [Dehalococcoidia bacterium]|nr:CoA transferase [Dehalococcoidia bacterium]